MDAEDNHLFPLTVTECLLCAGHYSRTEVPLEQSEGGTPGDIPITVPTLGQGHRAVQPYLSLASHVASAKSLTFCLLVSSVK